MMQIPRSIYAGFALAVILTAVPFASVVGGWLSRGTTLWLIGFCAISQIAVHLYFFLGVGFAKSQRDRTGPLLFTFVLLFIMVGGTIWVIGNLNWRMDY